MSTSRPSDSRRPPTSGLGAIGRGEGMSGAGRDPGRAVAGGSADRDRSLAADSMLIYGFHPVREALRHRPHELQRVLIGDRRQGKRRQEIEDLCRRHRLEVRLTPEAELSRLVDGVHNGFVAEVNEASTSPSATRHRRSETGANEIVVLVEDLQDPRNLGALLQSL